MSEKSFKRVLAALGALVAIYLVVSLLGRGGSPGRASGGSAVGDLLATVDTSTLESVRVVGQARDIALLRTASGWTANGLPADSGAVARLLAALADATVGDLVSDNPDNHARLHVIADSGLVVTIGPEADQARLLVGKSGPGSSAYFRAADADEVFLVDGLRAAVALTMPQWRDRVIAALDTAAAQRVVVTRDGQRSELARTGERWAIASAGAAGTAGTGAASGAGGAGVDAGAARADSVAVLSLLRELARLTATGFAPDSVGMPADAASVLVLGATGDTLLSLELAGQDSAADWLVRTPGRPGEIFTVPDYRIDRIVPPRATLVGAGDS